MSSWSEFNPKSAPAQQAASYAAGQSDDRRTVHRIVCAACSTTRSTTRPLLAVVDRTSRGLLFDATHHMAPQERGIAIKEHLRQRGARLPDPTGHLYDLLDTDLGEHAELLVRCQRHGTAVLIRADLLDAIRVGKRQTAITPSKRSADYDDSN